MYVDRQEQVPEQPPGQLVDGVAVNHALLIITHIARIHPVCMCALKAWYIARIDPVCMCALRHGVCMQVAESKFLNNRLVDVVEFMENISVKDALDKVCVCVCACASLHLQDALDNVLYYCVCARM